MHRLSARDVDVITRNRHTRSHFQFVNKEYFMKLILLICATLTPTFAFAWDAVGVFHHPEKVVIQINEYGDAERLQSWMNAMGSHDLPEVSFLNSNDDSLKALITAGEHVIYASKKTLK